MLQLPGNEDVRSVNPIVGETNDGYLNDIRARRVSQNHVLAAIANAKDGPVSEGCVGAGTGTRAFGWKGGIGTASRRLPSNSGEYTLGVLVQTNFDGILTIAGAPVGQELRQYYLRNELQASDAGGSCMIVLATDAPLDARQLERVAKRALLGLGAVGSPMTHGSGDYVIAFSTSEKVRVPHAADAAALGRPRTVLRDEALSPLFQAAREATEEAIINSLFAAKTTSGHEGHVVEAIPIERVMDVCRRHGVIRDH
jgi:D-aminopeptidase